VRTFHLIVACGLLAAAGCQPGVGATATGIVSFDGVPAPAGVLVVFYPQGPNSSSSMAITDASGKYELWFNAGVRGVMPGENVVSLAVEEDLNASRGVPATDALQSLEIPARYRGPRSPIVKTVKPGANVIDVEVTLSEAAAAK
jgi:hypothetical protein